MTQREEQIYRKTDSTKNYDAVGKEVRKLIAATAVNYVRKLCEALRRDWYPLLTDAQFKANKEVQDDIKEKVLNDYSRQRNENTEEYGWSETTIADSFPDWLRNPTAQEGQKRASQKRYQEKIKQDTGFFDRLTNALPEPPKQPEPKEEPEPTYSYSGTGTIYEPPEKYVPTPEELYEDAIHGFANAWYALTNKDHIPGINEDVLVDYIKPSDKHRLRILKGIDDGRAAHLVNVMAWTNMIIKRTIEAWNEMQKEPTKRIAIK